MNSTPADDRKFLELVNENRNKILRVCRVYAWNSADQDDLYQEIVFQIWRGLPGLKEKQFANTWLYRVAINTAMSFVRKRSSRSDRVVHFEPVDLARAIESRQPTGENPDDRVAGLYNAIYKLDPIERALVTLFLEDLTYEQIAEATGISAGNVGVMLHRAKKKLSSLMKEASEMNDDELKQLWQQQPLREPEVSAAQLISAMQSKMGQFRRTVLWRDIREVLACVFLIIIFGYYFSHRPAPIARLGDLIVIGSSIFIAWKLVYTHRKTPPAPPGSTIVEALRAELNSVRAQCGLLGSVLWWYLLPLTVGELVFIWGGPVKLLPGMAVANFAVTLVVIAVNVGVYWLNQWARSKQLLPVEAQLESLLRSAETGEPLDETQTAKLRPIVLSMTAADGFKPVEFKVAFWQLALYGEIGFVGIWFFSILGLEGAGFLGTYPEDQ